MTIRCTVKPRRESKVGSVAALALCSTLLALGLGGCAIAGTKENIAKQLKDRDGSFEIFRRLSGRPDGKPFFVSARGNVYGFKAGEPAIPVASILGLWTMQHDALPDGSGYIHKGVYCGTYTPFGTEEVTETLTNPFTGEPAYPPRITLNSGQGHQVRTASGYKGAEGVFAGGLRMFPTIEKSGPAHQSQIAGDKLYMIHQIYIQDFIDSPMKYEEAIWSGKLTDVANTTLDFVPASWTFVISSKLKDQRWLGLEDAAWFQTKHITGEKVASPQELPKSLLAYVKSNCPEHLEASIFDRSTKGAAKP